MENLKFVAPTASADLSFWEKLYKLKLNKYRISSEDKQINSFVVDHHDIVLTEHSFLDEDSKSSLCVHGTGNLRNVNTINDFVSTNKPELLTSVGKEIWRGILTGAAVSNISSLFDFILLTFADLKQYKFTHWIGYPALVPDRPYLHYSPPVGPSASIPASRITDMLATRDDLIKSYGRLFVLVRRGIEGDFLPCSLSDIWNEATSMSTSSIDDDIIFVTSGLGGDVSNDSAPWGLRNVLALLAVGGVGRSADDGRVVRIWLMGPGGRNSGKQEGVLMSILIPSNCFGTEISEDAVPRVVGWQPNERGKPSPRVTDASSVMDTKKIMEQAVDLNLRLMKWRMWPDLDTEMLATTKCLLLGAGTLGCAVARTLMGWGVRDITFVDNGRVSYSNPARQSLFEYDDCISNSYKSTAAAARLKKIFPGMRSEGVVLTIPMPGHPIPDADRDSFQQAVARLDALVKGNDVIFALTDSREARWLPTVMCSAHDKLMINSALGFDSYLIMRHGHGVMGDDVDGTDLGEGAPQRLGCYFCMDVSAPGNSQRDKTIDQQCTVTRPGLAQIASGFAAEMMVALLHSRSKQRTCAKGAPGYVAENADDETPIPHQIRGFLTSFAQVEPVCLAFPNCTACSRAVVREYALASDSGKHDFVASVCAHSEILEQLSGVSALTAGLDDLDILSADGGESDEDDW